MVYKCIAEIRPTNNLNATAESLKFLGEICSELSEAVRVERHKTTLVPYLGAHENVQVAKILDIENSCDPWNIEENLES